MNNKETLIALSNIEPLTNEENANINALIWLSKYPFIESLDIEFYEEWNDEGGTYSAFCFNNLVLNSNYIDSFLNNLYETKKELESEFIEDCVFPDDFKNKNNYDKFNYLLKTDNYIINHETEVLYYRFSSWLDDHLDDFNILQNYKSMTINMNNIDWESQEITNLLTKYKQYITNLNNNI